MPLPKDKDNIDNDQLSNALMTAGVRDKEVATSFGYRVKEIDAQEDELISLCQNTPGLRLSTNPSLLDCIAVQSNNQKVLNRLTEIELNAIRISTKIRAQREAISNNILATLGSSGSAESRKARAASATEVMNLLISLEEGLLLICETARKNLKSSIDSASRAQTAIMHEVQYLDGSDIAKELNNATRGLK